MLIETADAYVLSDGVTEMTLRAGGGAVWEYRLDQGNGVVLVPHAGFTSGLGANGSGS